MLALKFAAIKIEDHFWVQSSLPALCIQFNIFQILRLKEIKGLFAFLAHKSGGLVGRSFFLYFFLFFCLFLFLIWMQKKCSTIYVFAFFWDFNINKTKIAEINM